MNLFVKIQYAVYLSKHQRFSDFNETKDSKLSPNWNAAN